MLEKIWNKKPTQQVEQDRSRVFETTVLPYISSGYNLARWLTRNEQDAEDALQEASLRAWRAFDTFQPGRNGRAWFMAIVRNTCRTLRGQKQGREVEMEFEDDSQVADSWLDPEALLIREANLQLVHQALEELPFEYREIIVLRELEELSYKEIAKIVDIPLGTVMSRLSRARRELYARLCDAGGEITR
ncbi:MAG TPA: sigma-70 family RNA polymerase sigma factor [Edaphobacter sp.]|nr:sigma-70 family RNA polymerase sigma factor [Edaphobacter sp.]